LIKKEILTMRWKYRLFPYLMMILIISATSLIACGGQELTSTWRDREVTVDGLDAEWQGAVSYIEKENIAIGLLNDEDYLYICLATVDARRVRQILGSGLTLWFDPEGGKEKRLGINFPLGKQLSREDMDREKMPMPREEMPDPERLERMVEESAQEMVILGPGKNEHRRMPVYGSEQIQVKLGYSGGKLVYELRVPLIQDEQHPDAIGLGEGQFVGVWFETAEIDREMMRERMRDQMGGKMPPGGRGMSGGGMRGGGMRGGPMPGGAMTERLELWTKVELASGNLMEPE
jgi:hypothetical protein